MELVTICVPTYNDECSIKATIDSVLTQTYKNLEILIADNCSEDNTFSILEKFQDDRIILMKNKSNLGWQGNSNKLLKMAKGKYVFTLHGDDYYKRDDYIECIVEEFEQNMNLGIIHTVSKGNISTILNGKMLFTAQEYLKLVCNCIYCPAPTVTVFRNTALIKSNYYEGEYWNTEYRLSNNIAKQNYEIYFKEDEEYFYRFSGEEKDSQIPRHRILRLEQIYTYLKELINSNNEYLEQSIYEEILINELHFILRVNKGLLENFYEVSIVTAIKMINDGYLSREANERIINIINSALIELKNKKLS